MSRWRSASRSVLMAKPAVHRPIVTLLMNAKNDPTAIDIRLLEPIRGHVHDEDGRPLPQITVGRSITFEAGQPDDGPTPPKFHSHD